ncbi:MAG: hypothetical protein ACI30M_04180, partial [Muribaculaceae bacterium]
SLFSILYSLFSILYSLFSIRLVHLICRRLLQPAGSESMLSCLRPGEERSDDAWSKLTLNFVARRVTSYGIHR